MADNLVWLLTKKFPDKKIIVSTSSYHMSRGLFKNQVVADFLSDSIVSSSYFVPFISYKGSHGFVTDIKEFPIKKFERDAISVEKMFHTRRIPYGFLNLQSLKTDDIRAINSLRMYPSLEQINKAKWTTIYDGIFFIDEMEPERLKSFSIADDEYIKKVLYKMNQDKKVWNRK